MKSCTVAREFDAFESDAPWTRIGSNCRERRGGWKYGRLFRATLGRAQRNEHERSGQQRDCDGRVGRRQRGSDWLILTSLQHTFTTDDDVVTVIRRNVLESEGHNRLFRFTCFLFVFYRRRRS
jgi:hypothetical protein